MVGHDRNSVLYGKAKASFRKNQGLNIIPAPNNVQSSGTPSDISQLKIFLAVDMKSEYFTQLFGDNRNVSWVTQKEANVQYRSFPELEKEGYRLEIKKDSIIISASGKTGMQYGMVSLAQILGTMDFIASGGHRNT
ncbi:MAG: hypothetical protein IPP49_15070 [Saprospiraceae bacterium]|nr:hypothetical protein [Saprospiraceae bacterium]